MTREEQYQEAASKDKIDTWKNPNYEYSGEACYFILGAEWADTHPVVNKHDLLSKCCDVLRNTHMDEDLRNHLINTIMRL